MSAGTGENEMGLRKVLDFTRLGSIVILFLHFYYQFYQLFDAWGYTAPIGDRLIQNLERTGLFGSFYVTKGFAISLLIVSLVGAKGKKSESLKWKPILILLSIAILIYFFSQVLIKLIDEAQHAAVGYMVITSLSFLLVLSQGTLLSRVIHLRLSKDIFNELNESFPQEERWLNNEYSVNLPALYELKGKTKKSFINIINPFRGLLVIGSPGAGKSWFVIQHVIKQHLEKGFAMFIYDFKFDDLSNIAYNWLQRNYSAFSVRPSFHVITFDNLNLSHRCNPLDPSRMTDITDATESARTILLGLNKEWINKQGDFFVESPINFVTAVIWFLRTYEEGKYCTLPHVIELMQVNYDELFPVLNTVAEIEVLINPFITAYENDAMEQLEGQVASAKIGMARLASPQLYWVLSGNDFTLDINNPDKPKVVCMGNNPEKQQIYSAVLSLFVSRMIKQVNKKEKLKCSLVFDEFPTIFINNIDSLMATARSNKVATTLGMQDFSQLKKDYGKDQADVIMNITGNIISGQVTGETARQLSERFGKIMQDRESISINRTDTSVSKSKQLDTAVPASKIACLSSGEFVGMVADDPDQKIKLKSFHAEIQNNRIQLQAESKKFTSLPVVRSISPTDISDNFHQIKLDVKYIIDREVNKLRIDKKE